MSGAVLDHVVIDPKSGSLVYRRRFPQHLIPLIPRADGKGMGRKELRVSLKAKNIDDPNAAKLWQQSKELYRSLVDAALLAHVQQERTACGDFDVLTSEQVKSLAESYYVGILVDDEVARRSKLSKNRFAFVTKVMREQGEELPEVRPDAEWTHSAAHVHRAIRSSCRAMRAKANYDDIHEAWGADAVTLSSDAGFVIDPKGECCRALAEALNDSAILASEAVLRRLDGDDVPTPAKPVVVHQEPSGPQSASIDLMDVFERYRLEALRLPRGARLFR